jgi:hypothetical protein
MTAPAPIYELATPPRDSTTIADSRVTGLFSNATKFKAFVQLATSPYNEIERVICTNTAPEYGDIMLATILDLFGSHNYVQGVWLDLIGKIIGLRREVASAGQTVVLDDASYLQCLAARVIRNNYTGLWDGENGLLEAVSTIFSIGGIVPAQVFQVSPMFLIFTLGRTLTAVEVAILNNFRTFLPINQGVGIDTFITYGADYFGWQEDAGSDGYCEISLAGFSTNGGSLAENVI